GARAVIPRFKPPERPRFLVADLDALAVPAVARRAPFHVDRLAAPNVERRDRDELALRDRVLAAPRWIDADWIPLCQPREVRRHGEYLLRRGRQPAVGVPAIRFPRVARRFGLQSTDGVLAAQEAVDDAVAKADEARRAVVVFGKHARNRDQRHRAFA